MASQILESQKKSSDNGYDDESKDSTSSSSSMNSNDNDQPTLQQQKKTNSFSKTLKSARDYLKKEQKLKKRGKSQAELELRQLFFSDPGSNEFSKRNSWRKNSDSFQFQTKSVDWNEEFQNLLELYENESNGLWRFSLMHSSRNVAVEDRTPLISSVNDSQSIPQSPMESPQSSPSVGTKSFSSIKQRHLKLMQETLDKLELLEKRFVECCEKNVKTIVLEQHLPLAHKTIPPRFDIDGVVGGSKYVNDNIFFKFCVDRNPHGSFFHNDDLFAGKVASHEFRSLMSCICVLLNDRFSFPLFCMIEYSGYRVACFSLLPIDQETCVAGSFNAGKQFRNTTDPKILNVLQKISTVLNLKPHIITPRIDPKTLSFLSFDCEAHIGYDGRLYLIDLQRLLPPQAPTLKNSQQTTTTTTTTTGSNEKEEDKKQLSESDYNLRQSNNNNNNNNTTSNVDVSSNNAHKVSTTAHQFARLLRPEFVAKFSQPLNSDVFLSKIVQDNNAQDKQELRNATTRLFHEVIPDFASRLISQNLRGDEEENNNNNNITPNVGFCKLLVQKMHRDGINCRFLPLVYLNLNKLDSETTQSNLQFWKTIVLIESLARSLKDSLSKQMHNAILKHTHEMTSNASSPSLLPTERQHRTIKSVQEKISSYLNRLFSPSNSELSVSLLMMESFSAKYPDFPSVSNLSNFFFQFKEIIYHRLLSLSSILAPELSWFPLNDEENVLKSDGVKQQQLSLSVSLRPKTKTLNILQLEKGRLAVEMSQSGVVLSKQKQLLLEAISNFEQALELITFDYRSMFNLAVSHSSLASTYVSLRTQHSSVLKNSENSKILEDENVVSAKFHFRKACRYFERSLQMFPKSFDRKEVFHAYKHCQMELAELSGVGGFGDSYSDTFHKYKHIYDPEFV